MKVAIIGRPNVGKSTLFNAFTKTRDALVHDRPGITRDVVSGVRDGVEFLDTAGLDRADELSGAATELALAAAAGADAILFVVDAKAGLHSMDLEWAKRLRKFKNIFLLANKSDTKVAAENLHEFYKLGMGEPIPVSAEHNLGLSEVFNELKNRADNSTLQTPNSTLKVAVMGVPNVGKSTLINRLAGSTRVLVMDRPGITRDAVRIDAHYLGRDIEIIDTAGLRRKTKISDGVETLSALKALDAMAGADAAILVIDANAPVEAQSVKIAERIFDAGKILVVAMNKWDLVADKEDTLLRLKHEFARAFAQIQKPVLLPISAEKGTGVANMMKRLYELWDISNARAPTSFVNRAIEKLVAAKSPPMSRLKRPMKIKFASQTGIHPAVITINVGGASDIPEAYTRYLRRGIAEAMGWESLPVSIQYQSAENPFN